MSLRGKAAFIQQSYDQQERLLKNQSNKSVATGSRNSSPPARTHTIPHMDGMKHLANGGSRVLSIHEMRAQEEKELEDKKRAEQSRPRNVYDVPNTPEPIMPCAVGGDRWSSSNKMPTDQLAVSVCLYFVFESNEQRTILTSFSIFVALAVGFDGFSLQENYRRRALLPAGMLPSRTMDSLSLYSNAHGTEHGNMQSSIPHNQRLQRHYHYDQEEANRYAASCLCL